MNFPSERTSILSQKLGKNLKGECQDFLAAPGRGLQCTVIGVEESGEGGERERVKRYPCVITEASLMGKSISKTTGDLQGFKVCGLGTAKREEGRIYIACQEGGEEF